MTAEGFVAGVAAALERLAFDDTHCTQDEIDVFLLGGTLPAWPIPRPDPECRECWGTGKVCSCHGFASTYAHARYGELKRCRCTPRPGRPKSR